ncbi:putative transposase [Allopseudospirillum japonicum]|uniref:Putative transposase n=1 Tax=Allopseudospirillum japonicum TaxID=64971 RepID=A0A1H6V2F5_9GAMM|nr:RNA-guided endonuclease TnpB family protein [Allopseudospirillum japonicum]SEI94800.1 putative transposase [Allopseudospirillum japonicum]
MLKATKIRIYPTPEQTEFLNAQFGAVRFAFNRGLAIQSHFYKVKGISLKPSSDIKPLLAKAKKSRKYQWLKQYDSIALQQGIIQLDKAFKNFFNPKLKSRYPRFKSKHGKQSSYHCTSVSVGANWIKIPKCQPITAKIHRELSGTVKSITLSRTTNGKYYASILVEDGIEQPKPLQTIKTAVGVDLGLTDFLTDSNGHIEANPKYLRNAEKNLKRKQRWLSRKQKGSANRAKARRVLANAHEKLRNIRNDFQHKLSRTLVDENQAVIVETLKSSNMMKNKHLAKAIGDVAWNSFVSKLEYKAKAKGHHLHKLSQWFAGSKTCSCCGHKMEEMPLNIREWSCPSCSTHHQRDVNAAINHLKQGMIELKAAGLSFSLAESV